MLDNERLAVVPSNEIVSKMFPLKIGNRTDRCSYKTTATLGVDHIIVSRDWEALNSFVPDRMEPGNWKPGIWNGALHGAKRLSDV